MKNIYEIMKEFGLEVPEDKKAEFDKSWKENYRTKSEYDKAVEQRDAHKASLDEVNEKLKEFEGVDVNDLKGQITKLQGDLKAKDDEYAAKDAERVFYDTLSEAIKTAGGRNAKSIMALLNVDELKASKNQGEDIKKALDTVKESDAYLFGTDEPFLNPVGATGGVGGAANGVETYVDKKPTTADLRLAECIHKRLVEYTGLQDRGIKKENWYVINQNKVPAVLTEGGFMDNKGDYAVITSEKGQKAYARAVAEGLIEFLKLEKKVNTTVSKPSNSKKDLGQVNVTYQVFTDKWWPAVTDQSDWAGKGDGTPIQAVELYYYTSDGYLYKKVHYRVSSSESKEYYAVQIDNEKKSGMGGYAGKIGCFIDKLRVWIE